MIDVPDFIGVTFEEAQRIAAECGITVVEYVPPPPLKWWQRAICWRPWRRSWLQ